MDQGLMRKGAAAGSPRGAGVYRRAQPTTTASRIAYSVSLLDIFPTLVDLASMGRPQPALADPIDGHSLVPMLYLGNKGALSSAVVFFFFWGGEPLCGPWARPTLAYGLYGLAVPRTVAAGAYVA